MRGQEAGGDEAFRALLVTRCHPDRLAGALDSRVGEGTLARLRQSRRLQGRLAALIAPAMVAHPGDAASDHGLMRGLDGHEAALLPRLIGAAWHARSVKLLISGRAVAELIQRIGPESHAFALRNADLALPNLPILAQPADLATAIGRDGEAGLGAWLAAQTPALHWSVLVRLPLGTGAEAERFPDGAALRAAPVIERILAGSAGATDAPEQSDPGSMEADDA